MSEASNKTSALSPVAPVSPRRRAAEASGWRDFVAGQRHSVARAFSREQVVSFIKTLAWVAPLTLLIWIWAEREQVLTERGQPIPFELVSGDPNRLVTLMPGQDRNILLDLQGPRARIQDVLQRLRGGISPQGLRIEPDPDLSPNQAHEISVAPLVQKSPLFTGITVLQAQPSRLRVVIDELVEHEARVVAPPGVTNLERTTSFTPATVRVRGPRAVIEQAVRDPASEGGKLTVYAQVADLPALNTPGLKPPVEVPVELPAALAQKNVTLVTERVTASLHVKPRDATWEKPSMPLRLDVSTDLLNGFRYDGPRSVAQVKLTGPPEVLESMNSPTYAPQPYAVLEIKQEDAGGEPRGRDVRYVNLPEGVKAEPRTVSFKLIRGGDAGQ